LSGTRPKVCESQVGAVSAVHESAKRLAAFCGAKCTDWHKADMIVALRNVRFSNRPVWVKRYLGLPRYSVDVAHGLVLLSGGRSIMGFENEADQSFGRLRHFDERRSKRTCDLTSFIVPRGTSCHRAVEFAFSPIGFDLALSCGCSLLLGPAELGAVNPDNGMDRPRSYRVNGNAADRS
jgi:hypothetical protein